MPNAKPKKATLYIEADDEITAVIDKVLSAKEKVVAVVLPKHASVFQSVVNMKLLKRSSKDAKKSLVLITSEPAITKIAGIAGVHIAKTLNTKPAIPKVTKKNKETTITTDDLEIEDAEGKTENSEIKDDDTIEIDNTTDDPKGAITGDESDKKKKLKFKIPDFSSFRIRMALVVLAVILVILGWFYAFVILPKVTITINTDTSRVDVATDFIAKVGLENSDIDNGVLAAQTVEVEKENSVTVPATGEKDVGKKASGIITLTNCVQSSNGVSVPAGTSFSSGSITFVSSEAVELGPAVYVGDECKSAEFPGFGAVKDVGAVASQPGEDANLSSRSYVSSVSGVTAFGSDMSGGTTKIAKVVSDEDIKKAENQLEGSSTADAIEEISEELAQKQLQALVETLDESDAKTSRSAKAGDETSELTVTKTVTYAMSGISSEDLSKLLDAKVLEDLADKTQNIRSNGLSSGVYKLLQKVSDTEFELNIRTVATLGPELNEEAIKQEIIGKELSGIKQVIEPIEGVRSIDVLFEPFWVFQVPDNFDKITIIINESE